MCWPVKHLNGKAVGILSTPWDRAKLYLVYRQLEKSLTDFDNVAKLVCWSTFPSQMSAFATSLTYSRGISHLLGLLFLCSYFLDVPALHNKDF